MKAIKKQTEVDFFRYGFYQSPEWYLKTPHTSEIEFDHEPMIGEQDQRIFTKIYTQHGDLIAYKGDYIIKGSEDEIYVTDYHTFKKLYEVMEFDIEHPIIKKYIKATSKSISDKVYDFAKIICNETMVFHFEKLDGNKKRVEIFWNDLEDKELNFVAKNHFVAEKIVKYTEQLTDDLYKKVLYTQIGQEYLYRLQLEYYEED